MSLLQPLNLQPLDLPRLTMYDPVACSLSPGSSHLNNNSYHFHNSEYNSDYNNGISQYKTNDRTLNDFFDTAKKVVCTAYKIVDRALTIKKIIGFIFASGGITTCAASYPLYSFFEKNTETELYCSPSRETIDGKLCRVKRWKESIESTEAKYKIPNGLLAGIAMAESYGDPTITNKDGSAGLFQLEPHIAEQYGLYVYYHGNNPKTSLQDLMSQNKPVVETLQAYDERFNVEKATETAGHYLHDLHSTFVKKQSLDKNLQSHDAWNLAAAAYAVGVSSADAHLDSHGAYIGYVQAYQRYYVQQTSNKFSSPILG